MSIPVEVRPNDGVAHLILPIQFGDWQGHAIRADRDWWISPRQMSDHLGLSWRRQQRKITQSNFASGMALRAMAGEKQSRHMMTLRIGHFGAWLLSISSANVPEEKRPFLEDMQAHLMSAIGQQLSAMFALPGESEIEELMALPLPDGINAEMIMTMRANWLRDPERLNAVRLYRLGLPGTRIAPALGRSVYWCRKTRKASEGLGLVTPSWQARLLSPLHISTGA